MPSGVASTVLTDIVRGDPRTITVIVEDAAGAPVDLSGAAWACTVRSTPGSANGIDLAVDVSAAADGVLGLSLSGVQSRLLPPRFVGDVEGSTFGTVLSFTGTAVPDVTQGAVEPSGGLVDAVTVVYDGSGTVLSDTVLALVATGPPGGTFFVDGDGYVAVLVPSPDDSVTIDGDGLVLLTIGD